MYKKDEVFEMRMSGGEVLNSYEHLLNVQGGEK